MPEYYELKVGDVVLVHNRNHTIPHITKVERFTKTMIFASNIKFNRQNGSVIGEGAWATHHLEIPTEEQLKEIKFMRQKYMAVKTLNETKWSAHALKKLTKIIEILKGE